MESPQVPLVMEHTEYAFSSVSKQIMNIWGTSGQRGVELLIN